MIKLKFTVRIKAAQNPPEFTEGLGKGVLQTVEVDFPTMTDEEFNSPIGQMAIYEYMKELLEEWIEVIPEKL